MTYGDCFENHFSSKKNVMATDFGRKIWTKNCTIDNWRNFSIKSQKQLCKMNFQSICRQVCVFGRFGRLSGKRVGVARASTAAPPTPTAAAPGDGGQESRKSHSSQLGLARMSSISEPVDELTPDLLPEGSVRRWISELVIAVDSLHFNGIVCG